MRRVLAVLALILACHAQAQTPRTLGYQGYLSTAGGAPVNASMQMTFALYGEPEGGVPLWSETQAVPVSNGLYVVSLGSVTPLPDPLPTPLYLAVTVGTDAEMTPRQALTAVPYSLFAASAGCKPGDMLPCYEGAAGTLNVGPCKSGVRTCNEQGTGFGACAGQVLPTAEQCGDLVDNNCNGAVNEGCGFANGTACTSGSQCTSGNCVDGVCCSSSCTGTCQACNNPGTAGTCTNIANGTDPSNECGGHSCASFYWGWVGDICYRRADATNSVVSCNGAGACQSVLQVCASQPQGNLQINCHDVCQTPTAGTCVGTTAGACTNINPGTQTCGVGPCQVTVPQCSNGVPVPCVPLC